MTSEEIFNEINKNLLESVKPSSCIKHLLNEGKLDQKPFNMIKKLEKIDQNPKYHPEGSVLNHTLLVVDNAAEYKKYSKDKRVFMWAALLHDIGKLTTTRVRKNRITSYNHDIEGEKLATEFLDMLTDDEEFKYKVSKLVRYHMQPLFFDKNLKFFSPKLMFAEVDHNEIYNLSLCDRLGRGNLTEQTIKEEKERLNNFREYCEKEVSGGL